MTSGLLHLIEPSLRRSVGIVESPGQILDFRRLDALSLDIATRLHALGAKPFEPVVAIIENKAADIATLLGIWRANAVAVPVHGATPATIVTRLQRTVGARFLINKTGTIEDDGEPPAAHPLLRGAALVIFTSGSTGRPKGVVIGSDRFAGKLGVLRKGLQFRPDDAVVIPLQLTFIFGLWVSLLALLDSARLILVPKFSAESMADAFRSGASVAGVVPTMLRSMGKPPAPRLRLWITGGEPLNAALAAQTRIAYPNAEIFDFYGTTETGAADFCLPAHEEGGVGTIGYPTGGVAFKIVDEAGLEAEPGGIGELQLKTPYGMHGYLDEPEMTEAAYSEGFFRTGDLARLRTGGRVELIGRRKDMISRGGLKIAPLELDALFAGHPGVAAALCGSVPDKVRGEAIHLLVVPVEGATVTGEQLQEWAALRIERYKLPDAIHFVDELPVGRTGKMDRQGVSEYAAKRQDRDDPQ